MDREVMITWDANQRLVSLLSESSARFLVIGGTAVRFHVPARREPKDLDLLHEPSAEACGKLMAAMERIAGPTLQLRFTPDECAQPNKGFPEKAVFNVDIFTPPTGLEFSEHWALAEEATMAYTSTRVRVASIPTLFLWP